MNQFNPHSNPCSWLNVSCLNHWNLGWCLLAKTYHFDIDLVPERRIRKHIVTMRESIQDQMGAWEPRFTEVIWPTKQQTSRQWITWRNSLWAMASMAMLNNRRVCDFPILSLIYKGMSIATSAYQRVTEWTFFTTLKQGESELLPKAAASWLRWEAVVQLTHMDSNCSCPKRSYPSIPNDWSQYAIFILTLVKLLFERLCFRSTVLRTNPNRPNSTSLSETTTKGRGANSMKMASKSCGFSNPLHQTWLGNGCLYGKIQYPLVICYSLLLKMADL